MIGGGGNSHGKTGVWQPHQSYRVAEEVEREAGIKGQPYRFASSAKFRVFIQVVRVRVGRVI